MKMFIDEHREDYGVSHWNAIGPIDNGEPDLSCAADRPVDLPGPCPPHADPSRLSGRAKRDGELRREIQRVWEEPFQVHGVRKVSRDTQN
jgi:putative transposase